MLHEIHRSQPKDSQKKAIIFDFLKNLQPDYPQKLQVEYKREGDQAIPLGMANVYPNAIAMGMDSGKPIAMGTKSDMEMINQYDIVDDASLKVSTAPIIEEDKQN